MKLESKFKQLKKEKRKAFIGYVPFGFPNVGATKGICLSLQRGGADILELGLPFSDPLADGPIIQKATTAAIKKGADIEKFLKFLSGIKKSIRVPLVVMSYYNPVFNFGLDKFFKEISRRGVSAVILVDLPLEESKGYIRTARKFGIDPIFFITPATTGPRARKIVKAAKGFIYYVSVTGITGPKSLDYEFLTSHVRSIKKMSKLPVCLGFGIHKRTQVRRINKFSDGVIVGSALVEFIEKNYLKKGFSRKLETYVQSLKK